MVFLGGGLGSLVRYSVSLLVLSLWSQRFPLGTFLINITGSFLVGFAITFLARLPVVHPRWHLLLVVGFMGGYTTFSAFEWETLTLIRFGDRSIAALYMLSSILVGLCAVWLGERFANRG